MFAERLIQFHNALHWWGPAIAALYVFLVPWVIVAPGLHPEDDAEMLRIARITGMWALWIFYAWWFALPYWGTEILLWIVLGIPALLIYGFLLVVWFVEGMEARSLTQAKAEGRYYYDQREVDERFEAELRAAREREALLLGQNIRKDKFHVVDGRKSGD